MLYAAEQRLAAFVETLQKWRPSIDALAALETVLPGPGLAYIPELEAGRLPADWRLKRALGMLRLLPKQRWLDLRSHETRETLRVRLAPERLTLGHEDFDLSDALGRDRRLTQRIALLAFEEGFQGIANTSRFDTISIAGRSSRERNLKPWGASRLQAMIQISSKPPGALD